jgi:poly(A) polymerase
VSPDLDEGALDALLARPPLRRLLAALQDGEEARIVGGAVRNTLIGRPVTDIDLATTALPEIVERRARSAGFGVVPTGIEHGTLTVIGKGASFEVTTLREDIETHGRHATVRFGRDFVADALRRDFTINALSVSADGRLHDHVGGLADLRDRRVRFIGDAGARIREDYLRILRFFRFHAEYAEGDLDPQGLAAVVRERAGLAILSRERIRAEFLKLLVAPRALEVISAVSELGLLTLLTGGVGEVGRLGRAIGWEAGEGEPPDPMRRLAALLVATREDADRLRDALRLSNAEHERLYAYAGAVASLKSRGPLDEAELRRLLVRHGPASLRDALAAIAGEPRPVLPRDTLRALGRLASGEEAVPEFPLRGADLLARGLESGPGLGAALAAARTAWIEAGCPLGPGVKERLVEVALKPRPA